MQEGRRNVSKIQNARKTKWKTENKKKMTKN